MSLEENSWKEPALLFQKQFFSYFYHLSPPPSALWKPLKDKYSNYKQQSYNAPKRTSEISFIKKFAQVCAYIPFAEQIRADRIDIPIIQETMDSIFDEHEQFFGAGGWKVVKNKSIKTHVQELLLVKLWKLHNSGKVQGTLGNFLLGFFYTLNYYKTCNYQIRLFNQFMLADDLESLFIFILLRKKSRRISKDLIISSHHITNIVHVLKGERSSPPSLNSYSSLCGCEELGEVKLLLIYPEIMEYINKNGVVLHEIMIYTLMRCVGMIDQSVMVQENTNIDWNRFLTLYFKEVAEGNQNYQQEFIARVARANLRMADTLFKLSPQESTSSVNELGEMQMSPRQKFLEESFGWLISVIEGIMTGNGSCRQQWQRMYDNLELLYEQGLSLGNRLVESFLKSQDYFSIYSKYQKIQDETMVVHDSVSEI